MSDELPRGWAEAPLADMGKWMGGGTPSKSRPEYWQNGTVYWVSPKDMKRMFIDSAQDQITTKAVRESATNLIPRGSVLMVTRSGILEHTFPVAVNTVPVAINQDLKALTPHPGVSAAYLAMYLKSASQKILAACSKDGTTVSSVDSHRLARWHVPVAPSVQQERIVSRLDELLSRMDAGARSLQRARSLLESYRKSVLKAAVTGEFTRDWRERHEREVAQHGMLLAEAVAGRRPLSRLGARDKLAKHSSPSVAQQNRCVPAANGLGLDTALPLLPAGWTWVRLVDLAAIVDRAIQSGPFGSSLLHSEFQNVGRLVIGIDNVRDGWFSVGSGNRISDRKFKELSRFQARPNDFLITVMASIGRTCVVPEDLEPAIITKHVYRITLDADLVVPQYINLCVLGNPVVRSQIFGGAQGGTRPGLNKTILERIAFPIPSIPEQRAIVSLVQEKLKQVQRLSSALDRESVSHTKLGQSILHAAFTGRLVLQDPNDEPASVLLERIAADRAAARPATKPSHSKRNLRK